MKKLLLLVVLSLPFGLVFATDGSTSLAETLKTSDSFTARFTQRVFNAEQTLVEESQGHMTFLRPGKFRWVYEQPYEQEIISDGKTLWVYDKDLEQVSIRPVTDQLGQTPIMLLDQPTNISQQFNVEQLSDEQGEAIYQLTSKHEDAGFQSVILFFTGKVLSGMKIHDNFDQTSHLDFQDINLDQEPDSSVFDFDPPQGVDVIRASEQPH